MAKDGIIPSYQLPKDRKKYYEKLQNSLSDVKRENGKIAKSRILKKTRLILSDVDGELETQTWVGLIQNGANLSFEEIECIKILLSAANLIYTYSGGDTGMTDSEYDLLLERVKSTGDNFDPSLETDNLGDNTLHHTFPSLRGTLDKVYYLDASESRDKINKSRRGLPEWIKSTENRYRQNTGKNINLSEELVSVFPKFDGVSCIFELDKNGKLINALTRGDTENNEAQSLTYIFKDMIGMSKEKKPVYGIKTELMMSEENFRKFLERHPDKHYRQSRSAVSSIINSDEPDKEDIEYIHPFSLRKSYLNQASNKETEQELADQAYDVPYITCRLKDIDKIRQFAVDNKFVDFKGETYRTDGLVIYIMNKEIRKALGRENHKQKSEVAYKFTEEYAYTKLVDVIFTIGLFGKINPVALIEPVNLKGNTISKASLGSISRLKSMKLKKGCTVKLLYDIIPYIALDDNCYLLPSKGDKIHVPKKCPDCGAPLETLEDSEELYCRNKECPCRQRGRILNYLQKMDIDGISYATVYTLYNERLLRCIEDIYKIPMNKDLIAQLPGFGHKSANNMAKTIEEHMNNPVAPSKVLGSIGIYSVGLKKFEKILTVYSFDEVLKFATERNTNALTGIKGIDNKTAIKIVEGILDNLELIKFLKRTLNISEMESLTKFKVAFTKIRNKDLEDLISSLGGSVSEQLTKDTNLLIVPSKGVSSSKVTKANKYNIPIMTIEEAPDYIRKRWAK